MWRRFFLAWCALAIGVAGLFARGGGGCVAAGSLIETPDGPRAIETLRAGDPVWSERGGVRVPATVRAVYAVEPVEFIELSAGGRTLRVTPEHPVQTAPGEFVRADRVPAGAGLFNGEARAPLAARRRIPADRAAYNLLVSPGGVFFANGLLVHNKGCFLPDTPVTLADGTRRPIGELRVGDRVLAFADDGAPVTAAVLRVVTHEVDGYLVVRTAGAEVHVTEEHPFYVGEGVFRTIESLRVGDAVYALDGARGFAPQPILAMERRRARVTVYNLEVDAPHTYLAHGLAVHNKGGGCFAPGTLVSTPRGPRPIESLSLGEQVLAPLPDGSVAPAEITGVYLNLSPLLTLRTSRGDLRTTEEHPLLAAGGSFVPAGGLRPGDRLLRAEGGDARILAVARGAEPVPVYTLQVAGPHTFVADGFVVHNKGGGGFHGGGHGGFRSRGPGSGGGDAPPGVVLAIIGGGVILYVIVKRFQGDDDGIEENLDYCFPRSAIEPKEAKTRKLLEFIARTDESVDRETLARLASSTFRKLQECWADREYEPMRPLLMPSLHAEHCAQLRGLRQTHEINRLEDLRIEQVDIVHLHYADEKEQRFFTALFTVWLRDYYVDDRTLEFLRGDEQAARFQEFWVFQHHEGAWRLREIEQPRESDCLKLENFFAPFTETGRDQVYGETAGKAGPLGPDLPAAVQAKDANIDRLLNFLVVTDKIWDREAMIATARRAYLGVLLAWQDGRPEMFAGLPATPEIAASLRAVNEANRRNGWRVEYRNLCVRKIEIVHVNNRHERGLDEYTVRISAHAQTIATQNGIERHRDEFVRPWVEFWTFVRADHRWTLKEMLPGEKGSAMLALENVDEGSSSQMLEWYYSKERAA